jgi:hypothetical protein
MIHDKQFRNMYIVFTAVKRTYGTLVLLRVKTR